ncbi:MAG: ATP-binding protein [Magnetococcales bacterium]|nr:ATP-binding protein [Magnetococcales bacterium]MBF0148884.1 ATP-binding protein [Magnetococcales bacterium]
MSHVVPLRPRERSAILQSLRAGVAPRHGLQHIQVGRAEEVHALVDDLDRLLDGGATIRFIIGDYGSGKTFFLNLIRAIALEKGLVVATADLNPDRRLHATRGQARILYAELMRNLATRTKHEGDALSSVVERFVSTALKEGKNSGESVETVIYRRLEHLSEMVGGYDFAEVIAAYWRGHESGNDSLKTDAVRWLRGEYATRTEARHALGVRTIVDDANVYDQLKLMARFVRLADYRGLLVGLDEMVNLYKMANTQARQGNYEQILRILNDALQGATEGLGFLMAGTPEFLTDPRRGLYSYSALESRLRENRFAAQAGVRDFSGPVIRLANLTQEDLYVLLGKLRLVQAGGDPTKLAVPDEALHAFMHHCAQTMGSAYFQTPRNTIRAFLDLLAVLEHAPGMAWEDLLGRVQIQKEENLDLVPLTFDDTDGPTTPLSTGDDDLHDFRL